MTLGERPWRRLGPELFQFATTDLRDLHLAVMCAFEQAAVLQPALRLEQVRAGVVAEGWDGPLDDAQLDQSLKSLVGWGLLDVTQDHAARYATPEEFERRNLQWSLTATGQAAVGGVLHALAELSRAVGLQPAVLDAIGDGLVDLHALVTATPPEDARIATRLAEVEGHLDALVTSVRGFNTHLQKLLREDATDDEVFLDVKQRTVSYLNEYIAGVDRPTRRIAEALGRLRAEVGAAVLHDRALAGANLAPVGDDPRPGWLAERARRWDALERWFAPPDAEAPKIAELHGIAQHAITSLLRVLERRWERRRRSASAADDFRALARWFATAASEDEAHALFNTAFGLWPARHAHMTVPDAEAVASSTPWADAPRVEVAPALRTTGSLQERGRPRPVADPAHLRARRARDEVEALARHRRLRAALDTGGRVRLSSFEILEPAAFGELLALLGAALASSVCGDGTRRALSADGQVEVVLGDAGDGQRARLRTTTGTLTGPDLWVTIAVREQVGAPARRAAGDG